MDDSLKRLEERLEVLIPKGISDHGRERMEETIDNLASSTTVEGGAAWKWAVSAAACLGAAAGLALLRGPEAPAPMVMDPPKPVTGAVVLASYEPFVETLSSSREVAGRFDGGLAAGDGTGMPHRYWSYDLREEEEVVDEQSGYTIRIYSESQEWVPVRLTSL